MSIIQKLHKSLETSGKITVEAIITPKSQRNQLIDLEVNQAGQIRLKLKIRGIPEKGLVNEELIKFLAKTLKLPKSNLQIVRGHTNRIKLIVLTKHALQ